MIKSNLDVAYDIMQKSERPLAFKELWEEICKIQEFDEEEAQKRMAKFYTNLFMDGRFTVLEENTWDLRDRHKFQSKNVVEDSDEDDDEIIEDEDEEEIDDIIRGEDEEENENEDY